MDIPQGGEGYGALYKGLLRGSPMTTLLTRAPAQSPHNGPYGRLWDASGMLF
jgi:hypothetical protein